MGTHTPHPSIPDEYSRVNIKTAALIAGIDRSNFYDYFKSGKIAKKRDTNNKPYVEIIEPRQVGRGL